MINLVGNRLKSKLCSMLHQKLSQILRLFDRSRARAVNTAWPAADAADAAQQQSGRHSICECGLALCGIGQAQALACDNSHEYICFDSFAWKAFVLFSPWWKPAPLSVIGLLVGTAWVEMRKGHFGVPLNLPTELLCGLWIFKIHLDGIRCGNFRRPNIIDHGSRCNGQNRSD